MRFRTVLLLVSILLTAGAVTGCARMGYYLQSVRGQLDLMSRREPIAHMLIDPATPEQLRARLETATHIRDFASYELGLPDNKSYRSYADLERSSVVWNVFAAPVLSAEPRSWCFPFVGCVAYRGYFEERNALDYAAEIETEGFDVYVAGIAAYSTLGRFADPVLNTMFYGDDIYLAGLLFHELSHQLLYVRDATEFNESFATLVEEEGVRRWLASRDDEDAWQTWQHRAVRREQFVEMVTAARDKLVEIYASDDSEAVRLQRKSAALDELRSGHERWRTRIGGDTGYEYWFSGPLNNAQLSSVATYRQLVPAFRVLLQQADNDLERFYALVMDIGELDADERESRMTQLLTTAKQNNISGVVAAPE